MQVLTILVPPGQVTFCGEGSTVLASKLSQNTLTLWTPGCRTLVTAAQRADLAAAYSIDAGIAKASMHCKLKLLAGSVVMPACTILCAKSQEQETQSVDKAQSAHIGGSHVQGCHVAAIVDTLLARRAVPIAYGPARDCH